jgi:hypothetical protein
MLNIGMLTLFALKDAGDPGAAKAVTSWLSLADYQDDMVQVRTYWNQKTDVFECMLTWIAAPIA